MKFPREQWARLRDATPLTLSEDDLVALRGVNEEVDLEEVAEIYLPLSRLLNLYVAATQKLHSVSDTFLGADTSRVPYVIGMAGSVAVGKSTTARILRALLARWPDHPRVEIVTTDGFLYPNKILEERGLMERKGFPESYDRRTLLRFLVDLKSGKDDLSVPTYSHRIYDVTDELKPIRRPDIVILEGLNVLQTGARQGRSQRLFVSDFFDFSIYVDAAIEDVRRWYIDRFLTLRDLVFKKKDSYFHRYADLSNEEATQVAQDIWQRINEVNLHENIIPTRDRAQLILRKARDHSISGVSLRKI